MKITNIPQITRTLLGAVVIWGLGMESLPAETSPVTPDVGMAPIQTLSKEWTPLFDAKLSLWDSWVGVPLDSVKGLPPGTPTSHDGKVGTPLGLNNDPTHIFTVKIVDGEPVLHITGDIYGCIITKSSYSNYHFRAQFRWLGKKLPPRLDAPRDTGVLYHSTGTNGAMWQAWKRSIEFQVCEGEIGKLYGLGGATATVADGYSGYWKAVTDERKTREALEKAQRKAQKKSGATVDDDQPYQMSPSRAVIQSPEGFKPDYHENPTGEWNDLDLYVVGDSGVHLLNGQVVNVLTGIGAKNPTGAPTPVRAGQIQIQSEAAEAEYRRVEICSLAEFPPEIQKIVKIKPAD
jgi:hypothetical protein